MYDDTIDSDDENDHERIYSYYFDENQDELKSENEEDEETFPLQKTTVCQMCGEEAFVIPTQLPIRSLKETLF